MRYSCIVDHFCAWVEEVVVPIFKNESNMAKFPQCVSDGKLNFLKNIRQAVASLATRVSVFGGEVMGVTKAQNHPKT